MNKRKQQIVAKALELFNNKGVADVTLRGIALEVGISQGNLNYYFKVKDDIVEALYFNLVEEINQRMATLIHINSSMQLLYSSAFLSMQCFYRYRFLMRDLDKILSENAKIRAHYKALMLVRNQQFQTIFSEFVRRGIFRKEAFEGEYMRLHERMTIIGNNWLNSGVLFDQSDEVFISYHHKLLFEMIFPYLTELGRSQYDSLDTPKI
ncbi:MAG: TetR family transcriptional regulator [Cryomorphaceae bacterium]|nr:TetR family transcriptional regulator [Cryomorphaceae bacterium]